MYVRDAETPQVAASHFKNNLPQAAEGDYFFAENWPRLGFQLSAQPQLSFSCH
jgi:hypothetical protein